VCSITMRRRGSSMRGSTFLAALTRSQPRFHPGGDYSGTSGCRSGVAAVALAHAGPAPHHADARGSEPAPAATRCAGQRRSCRAAQ
jgi:hypothetical protein